jgi:hypothetical protein
VLNDPIAVLNSSLPIVDGTQLGVILDDTTTANPTPVNFRAFGTPKRHHVPNQPDQTAYVVHGILDALPFIHANPNTTLSGTSNTAISNIAAANNLNYVTNVAGNDSMTWLPGKHTWAGFTNHIARHSYINETAAMSWGVDEQKNLYFYNVVPLFSANPVAYISFGAPANSGNNSSSSQTTNNQYTCISYRAINRSGLFNSLGGYGLRTVQPQLSGNSTNKYLNSQATVTNNQLDINSDISAAVQPISRMSLTASDSGNSHANYMQARHQNHRLNCAYSQNVYVMLYQRSNLKLFDTVNFVSTTEGDGSTSLVNGTYVVTAISRVYWTNRYFEKLELTGNGPIVNSSGGLLN